MSTKDEELGYYICGRCRSKEYYFLYSSEEAPCSVCGYLGKDRIYTALPSDVPIDLSQY